jgi:hypothetical protein
VGFEVHASRVGEQRGQPDGSAESVAPAPSAERGQDAVVVKKLGETLGEG